VAADFWFMTMVHIFVTFILKEREDYGWRVQNEKRIDNKMILYSSFEVGIFGFDK